MNNQLRYLSLVLLSSMVATTHSMEQDKHKALLKEITSTVPTVEAQEQLAKECLAAVSKEPETLPTLLQPLSHTKKDELTQRMNRCTLTESCDLPSAYLAALELETDMDPLERDKTLVKKRKELWQELKAQHAVDDYLSGSEDEQDQTGEAAELSQIVTRVHRRDAQLKAKAARQQTLTTKLEQLQTAHAKRATQLDQLQEKKKPLDAQADEQLKEKQALLKQDAKLGLQKRAVKRLVNELLSLAQQEQFLEGVTAEQLQPVGLCTDLEQQKEQHATRLGALVVASKLVNDTLKPLAAQEKKLKEEQKSNLTAQAALQQSIKLVTQAQSIAQTDKAKLLQAIDDKLAGTIESKQKLEDTLAALRMEITEGKDDTKKRALRVELIEKERAVPTVAQTISNLKVARAQADGTYSRITWLAGGYK